MFGALSEQPPAPVKMRNALGWWWHTPQDTLDKIDPANLVRDTKVYVHTLWRLLTDPVLPLDFATHARGLLEELGQIGASLDGRFSVDGLVAAAEALRDAAAAGGHDDAALMHASRALAPVYYTSGDRFAHDPALPLPAWPVLQPLRELAKTERGSDAAHALTVSATRGRNRMLHALREAVVHLSRSRGRGFLLTLHRAGRQAADQEPADRQRKHQYRQHHQRPSGRDAAPFPADIVHEVHHRDRRGHCL
jgi:hypothetical protein